MIGSGSRFCFQKLQAIVACFSRKKVALKACWEADISLARFSSYLSEGHQNIFWLFCFIDWHFQLSFGQRLQTTQIVCIFPQGLISTFHSLPSLFFLFFIVQLLFLHLFNYLATVPKWCWSSANIWSHLEKLILRIFWGRRWWNFLLFSIFYLPNCWRCYLSSFRALSLPSLALFSLPTLLFFITILSFCQPFPLFQPKQKAQRLDDVFGLRSPFPVFEFLALTSSTLLQCSKLPLSFVLFLARYWSVYQCWASERQRVNLLHTFNQSSWFQSVDFLRSNFCEGKAGCMPWSTGCFHWLIFFGH